MLAAVVLFATGSLAWYYSGHELDMREVEGSVDFVAAYFNGGDGTKEHPYEIDNKDQFYNLAWLQYLGAFNQPDENGDIIQTYFVITDTNNDGCIDMAGETLPPIGTRNNPFLGNLDGNGQVIKNLVIDNAISAGNITGFPDLVENNDSFQNEGVQIVGLFGVIGQLPDDSYSYDSSVNEVSNFYVENLSVKTQLDTALIGVVAGYVNGTVSNVGVVDSAINIAASGVTAVDATNLTANLSDYSLVGYCTDAYKDTVDIVTVDVKDPSVTVWSDSGNGAGNAWGGSIDMLSLYNRLNVFRTAAGTSQTSYVSSETVVVDEIAETRKVMDQIPSSTLIRQYDSNSPAGSFSFSYNAYSNGSFSNEQYIYLMGKVLGEESPTPTKTVTTITKKNEFLDGFLISDGNENYLNLNAEKTGYVSGTSDVSATVWAQDNGGHIFTIDNETGYYYYLNAEGVSSSSTDANAVSSATVWTYTGGKYSCTVNGVTQYLFYDGAQWTLISENGYVITDGNGNYLTYTGTNTIANTTDANSALVFSFRTDDGINPSGTASTVINGTRYYLRANSGTLELSETDASSWSNSGNGLNLNGYYLHFDGANWTLARQRYTISNGSNYLNINANRTGVTNGTGDATATLWEFSSYDGTGTISTVITGTRYYLNRNNNNNLTVSQTNSTNWTHIAANGTIATNNRYFIYRYNNGWSTRWSTYQLTITEVTIENLSRLEQRSVSVTPTNIEKTPAQLQVVTRTVSVEQADYPVDTWFPLSVQAESSADYNVNDESLYPALANTGYVISGSNYRNSNYQRSGDIRVSKYTLSNISSSYANRALSDIYTIDGIGRHTISDSNNTYKKYADSKAKLLNILQSDNSYVYGLHFMDAAISKDDTITVDKVTINGDTYENYELPRHSIDFNLKKAGYINFFAGNYFPGNTSFFSLHQIFRSGNTITEIKEISKVYANENSNGAEAYIYQYSDGNYSSNDPRGDLLFDQAWIGNNGTSVSQNTNRLFYFEIPANAGEYALGSVSDSDGAYLIYLDISANAQFHEYTVTEESFTETVATYEYPRGVDFLESTADSLAGVQASAAISLAAGKSGGTISYDRIGDTVTFNARDGTVVPYLKKGVTVSDGTNTWTMGDPIASESATTEILTLRDYDTVSKETTMTVQTTTAEGTSAVRYTIYKDGSESEHTVYTLTQAELDIIDEAKRNPTENYVYTGTETVLRYYYIKPDGTNVSTSNDLTIAASSEPVLSYDISLAGSNDLTVYAESYGDKVWSAINGTDIDTAETTVNVTSSTVDATTTTYKVIYPDGEVRDSAAAAALMMSMSMSNPFTDFVDESSYVDSELPDIEDASAPEGGGGISVSEPSNVWFGEQRVVDVVLVPLVQSSDVVIEYPETVQEAETPDIEIEDAYFIDYYVFGDHASIVTEPCDAEAAGTISVFDSTVVLDSGDRLPEAGQNYGSEIDALAANTTIIVLDDPFFAESGLIRIEYTASDSSALAFDLGDGNVITVDEIPDAVVVQNEDAWIANIPATLDNLAVMAYCGVDSDGVLCDLDEMPEFGSYVIIPAVNGESIAVKQICVRYYGAPVASVMLLQHGDADLFIEFVQQSGESNQIEFQSDGSEITITCMNCDNIIRVYSDVWNWTITDQVPEEENPEDPENPENPVDPETPADPETPTEPEVPTEPETPAEPEIPTELETPTDPAPSEGKR